MSDQFVDKAQWEAFCNRLTRQLQGAQAEIEVAALRLGDQIEAEWVPLLGISYDPKDDVFQVAVENLDHLVRKPQSLALQQQGARLESLAIETVDGERHIVRLREPLALPAPEGAAR
jgi:hypothetical protein